ncbi:MAG: UDP-N-acetylglucosamine 2-epimerase (non-hydrolyzing) [Thermoflexales bacterium]|nr:UDP-N-acetylglucosamine 2-epimerase (non-hydrolyzing) [Thermoflexales bacterium]
MGQSEVKLKIVTVVGARPQFVKAAPLSRILRRQHVEVLVHTGQHYDDSMSAVFFNELAIPLPDYNLGVGSGFQGAQTGEMMARIEQVLLKEQPDWVLVYGDTNSTLAGALAAVKLHMRVAHIEAGLRSFNRAMPEEVNRVLVDHISDLLLCPGQSPVDNLAAEGITRGVHVVGDVMVDALAFAVERASLSNVLARLHLTAGAYLLATVHRAENTDDPIRLGNILTAFSGIDETIVFPVHPRTRRMIETFDLKPVAQNLVWTEPLGYLDMIRLERSARLILTDSGGVQKEAYWLGVPCVTLRDETEWVETVQAGWNVLVGADAMRIVEAVRSFAPPASRPLLYGAVGAAEHCVALLEREC